ncbi:MAG TPA: diacylglycerol kinase family protein [Candidatus Bipolaricaulota bacterium]|nr:diacylglycerol kinase family protein [Candidatus Bipolaricaulota bacterium]
MIFKFKRLKRSFSYAWRGLSTVILKEQNFRIHFVIALIVIILGLSFQIRPWEWVALLLVIFFVLLLEIVNTVFERVVDMLKPRVSNLAMEAKDVMSAAVLVAAIFSIIIGLLIFVPYLREFLSRL